MLNVAKFYEGCYRIKEKNSWQSKIAKWEKKFQEMQKEENKKKNQGKAFVTQQLAQFIV